LHDRRVIDERAHRLAIGRQHVVFAGWGLVLA
jgi:hypothetical protein